MAIVFGIDYIKTDFTTKTEACPGFFLSSGADLFFRGWGEGNISAMGRNIPFWISSGAYIEDG